MPKKRVFYGSERQLEGLMLVAKSLDFGVSLTLASVYNEMLNAHLALRATPKYKHQLKKALRHAESVAEQQRLAIMANMKKRDFYDAYSDAVIDCAKTDITLLRISMKQTLDDAKVEHSDALAWIEITHTLCSIAKIHYEGIVREATKKYGHNYHDEFSEFDPTNLLVAWTRVSRLASADIKEKHRAQHSISKKAKQ